MPAEAPVGAERLGYSPAGWLMPYAWLSDDFYDHPKVRAMPRRLRNEAVGLFVRLVSYSNRHLTDGLVEPEVLRHLDGRAELVRALVAVPAGFEAGLLEALEDGRFLVHDFPAYSKTRDQLANERAKKSAAGRLGGLSSGVSRRRGAGYMADDPPEGPPERGMRSTRFDSATAPATEKTKHPARVRAEDSDSDSTLGRTTSSLERERARPPGPDWRREGLPNLGGAPAVVARLEAIAGRSVLTAGDRQLTELDRLLERHGSAAVIDALGRLELDPDGLLAWPQIVWGLPKILEPIKPGPRLPTVADEIAGAIRRLEVSPS